MAQGWRIILGLVAGLILGAAGRWLEWSGMITATAIADPIGNLWLNALQMTIVPLVFALIVTGVSAAASAAAAGGVAIRTLIFIAILLTGSAIISAVMLPVMLDFWPISPAAAKAMQASAHSVSSAIAAPVAAGEWLRNIIPANVIKAAAEGTMLSLVLFALAFGFAATRISKNGQDIVIRFFQAIADTMLIIVGWVLWIAPLGVFALAFGVGANTGLDAFGALGQYIVMLSVLCFSIGLLAYPLAMIFGRQPLGRFARATIPAQIVAISTQSSLAALPAMITGSQNILGLSRPIAGVVLPLAVAMFRVTSPAANLGVVLYAASLYGVPISTTAMITGIAIAVLVSFGSISLPGTITFFSTTVPIAYALGVPVELLALLIAVETIPDIFRTWGNVTMDMALVTIVQQQEYYLPRQ